MWPFLYENAAQNVRIATYGVCIILAFSAACTFIHLRAQRHGLNPDHLVHSYAAAILGGLIGARLFTALTVDLTSTLANPMSLLSMSGLTYYGGVIGGLFAILLTAHWGGFLNWRYFDLVAPALIIGHTIGRIGCFFAGCCHGSPVHLTDTAFPVLDTLGLKGTLWLDSTFPYLATEFDGGVARYLNTPLYPTQLWSIAIGIILIGLLTVRLHRKSFHGEVVALMLIMEPLSRFLVELYRGDARGVGVAVSLPDSTAPWVPGLSHAATNGITGLTTSQVVGALMCAAGLFIWRIQRERGAVTHSSSSVSQ